jgi:hypothetical protein
MLNAKKKNSYGTDRLQTLGLTIQDGYSVCPKGNIRIEYFNPETNGKILTDIEPERKTFSERPLTVYTAQRSAPENLRPGQPKYLRQTGVQSFPYFCPTALKNNNSDTVTFTEGEIKTAVANKFNLLTVGFSGIYNYRLSYYLNIFLQQRQDKIANIVINYDSDGHRTNNSDFVNSCLSFYSELKTYFLLNQLAQPRIYICINRDPENKGIDDILQKHGIKAATEFKTLQTSKYFDFTEIRLNSYNTDIEKAFRTKIKKNCPEYLIKSDYYFDHEKTRRNYLTDIFETYKLSYNAIFGKIWNVPTGTGKTNLVIETSKRDKVIMFVPLLNIAEQTYKTAVQRGINAALYIHENKENVLTDIFEHKKDIQFIICTYQSIDSLYRNVKNLHEYNVICDEIHTAISTHYLSEYFNKIFDRCNEFKSVSGLTGTYLNSTHHHFNKLPTITLKLRNCPKTETKIISVKNLIKAAGTRIKKSISENRKVLILLNSKKERLTDLTKILTDSNINFDTINKDTKDSECYKNLIQSETLNSPVTICTSVIEMGTNIQDKKIDILIIGEHHAATIRQFSERIRNNEKRIFIMNKFKNYKNISDNISQKILASEILSKHLNNCIDELKSKNLLLSYNQIIDSEQRRTNFIYYSDKEQTYKTDNFAIDNHCFNIETKKQNSSPVALKNALLDFNFSFDSVNFDTDKIELTPEEILENSINKEQKKTARENDFNAVISELKSIEPDNIETAKIVILAKTKELKNDSGELIFYNQFLKLCEYSTNYKKLVTNFASTTGTEKKIKLLFSQYTHHRCEFSEKDIQHAIKTNFKAGEKIDRAELIERFINCIQPENVAMVKENFAKRIDSILANVRQFFDVKLFGKEKKHYLISELIL